MITRRGAGAVVMALVVAFSLAAPSSAGGLPEWLRVASARTTPEWAASARVITVHDEQSISVPRDGRIRIETREAIRILAPDGKQRARCMARYLQGSAEVHELRAWLIPPNGAMREFDRSDATEMAAAGNYTLYSELRALVIAPDNVAVGSLFAWEYVVEEDALVAQWQWFFQGDEPSLWSRISMTLPRGLEPVEQIFAADSVRRRHDDQRWSWELRDLRAVPDEPLASTQWSARASMVLGIRGASSSGRVGAIFENWHDVAAWLDRVASPQAEVTPEITSHAQSLTAATRDTLERWRILARDVQALNYVSIELGLGMGWGYRPHAAAEVMRLGYGDCKDKANLLRTSINALGGRAWLMAAYAGGRDAVDERWASPGQFNHCIIAIGVAQGTHLPAVFEHPMLGTLLAFDPTDPLVPFGQLPENEQGALVLIENARAGDLVRLPVEVAGESRLTRRIEAQLGADGSLKARIVESSVGGAATAQRRIRRESEEREYRKALESWLAGSGGSVTITSLKCTEDSVSGAFRLEASYESPRFARVSGSRMMTFNPALIVGSMGLSLPDTARTTAIALRAKFIEDSVTVELPADFEVDEIPERVHQQRDFGSLDAEWRKHDGALTFARRWIVRPMTIPVSRYSEVRDFMNKNQAASRAPAVLVRM